MMCKLKKKKIMHQTIIKTYTNILVEDSKYSWIKGVA